MENFQNEIQRQFFEYLNSNNRNEVIRYFREIEYKPWEYIDEDGNTAILRSTYLDFTLLTITMIDELKLRLGESHKDVLENWVNSKSKEGNTPLLYACFRGNIDLIEILIDNSADYTHRNNQGLNALHVSAQGNKPESLILMIERYKLDINSKDNVNSTPLHWACYTGSHETVNFILSREPEINIQDKDGYTPLHLAVISERSRIIKKLLQFGSRKDIPSNNNLTPLQLALDREKYNLVDLLTEKSCLTKFYVFRSPLHKVERTRSNVYFFLLLHLLGEVSCVLILLPFFNSKAIFYIYIYFFCQVLASYTYLLFSDPGEIKSREKLTFLVINRRENILDYCPQCTTRKTKDSLHCFVCDRCVDGFDHHCYWVNNCIGHNNHTTFLIFLFFLISNLFINIFVSIHSLVIVEEENIFNNTIKLPFPSLYSKTSKLFISLSIIILCILFIIPIMILLGFQLKTLFCKNELIVQHTKEFKREKSTSSGKNDEEKALLTKEGRQAD